MPTACKPRQILAPAALARRNELVTENMGLIGYVIHKMLGRPHPEHHLLRRVGSYDDLYQEGVFGLIDAAEKWNPDFIKDGRSVEFSTYATIAIQRKLMKCISEAGLIRVPCCAEKGARTKDAAAQARHVLIFTALRDTSGQPDSWLGLTAATEPDAVEDSEIRQRLMAALLELSERDQRILRGLFWESKTLRELGEELGCSKERIWQLKVEALEVLREKLEGVA